MRVVAVRYARDGERMNAWRTVARMSSEHRLSLRYFAVILLLLTPRPLWLRALQNKD